MRRYIQMLIERGFVEFVNGYFFTTAKGFDFLEKCEELMTVFSSIEGGKWAARFRRDVARAQATWTKRIHSGGGLHRGPWRDPLVVTQNEGCAISNVCSCNLETWMSERTIFRILCRPLSHSSCIGLGR